MLTLITGTITIAIIITVCAVQVTTTTRSVLYSPDYDDDYNKTADSIQEQMQKSGTTNGIDDMIDKLVNQEIRFTYGDDDLLGPLHWRDRESVNKLMLSSAIMNHDRNLTFIISSKLEKLYADSYCHTNLLSPINIETRHVRIAELTKDIDFADEETQGIPETLIISVLEPRVQFTTWIFGHATRYHGIQIHPDKLNIIQLNDNFLNDPFQATSGSESGSSATYDFHFLTLFYCDIRKSLPYRTMHQIDGKKFPLELAFVFLRKMEENEKTSSNEEVDYSADDDEDEETKEAVVNRSTLYDGEYVAVIVSVIGEIGPTDNIHFQPVVEAAKKFPGQNFNYTFANFKKKVVTVNTPWSPTWLLPDSSKYYYYDGGSFPVPPCWSVARYYVMRDRISISQAQLDVLTHIRSNREESTKKTLPCTYSISSGVVNSSDKLVSNGKLVNFNLLSSTK